MTHPTPAPLIVAVPALDFDPAAMLQAVARRAFMDVARPLLPAWEAQIGEIMRQSVRYGRRTAGGWPKAACAATDAPVKRAAPPGPTRSRGNAAPQTIDGVTFPTIRAMAEALRVDHSTLRKWLARPTARNRTRIALLMDGWRARGAPMPQPEASRITARTDRQIAEARRLAAEGIPTAIIAARLGVGPSTVRTWKSKKYRHRAQDVARSGTAAASECGQDASTPRLPRTDELVRQAAEMARAGMPQPRIARTLGRNPRTVRKYIAMARAQGLLA